MSGIRMYGYEAPDVSNREGVWRPVPEDEAREAVVAAARALLWRTDASPHLRMQSALEDLDALTKGDA